jgi:hypothetical protein
LAATGEAVVDDSMAEGRAWTCNTAAGDVEGSDAAWLPPPPPQAVNVASNAREERVWRMDLFLESEIQIQPKYFNRHFRKQ